VAKGDLAQNMSLEVDGGVRCAANSCTPRAWLTPWLAAAKFFASEVTRVAREVGTEGKLGGRRC